MSLNLLKRAKQLLLCAVCAMTLMSFTSESLILTQGINGRYGYATPTGRMVIRARYDNAHKFVEDRAAVERDGKWGYIDPNGKNVTKLEYDSAIDFFRGYGIVTKNKKWGAVNHQGELIVPCEFDTKEDLLSVKILQLTPEQAVQLKALLEGGGK